MTSKYEKVKNYLKRCEFSSSDFFLALGFIFMIPFAAFSWLFMVKSNPQEIFLTPRMMIVCFFMSAVCWGIYFYKEIKKGHIKNNFFTWAFILFAILSVVSVVVQPENTTIDVLVRNVNDLSRQLYGDIAVGDTVTVNLNNPWVTKMFFAFGSLLITTLFYIIFMVFPKRFKNMDFFIVVGIIIFTFLFVLAIYSYFHEPQVYKEFFRTWFDNDLTNDSTVGAKSFIVHNVPYGACMMMGLMFALVLHGYTHKWYWIIPMVFCSFNMVFSLCKTSLGLSALVLFLYFIFRMIATFKKHKIRNLIIGPLVLLIVIAVIVLTIISVVTDGDFLPFLDNIFSFFTNKKTIISRTYIWKNINELLKNGWWIIGRGFGTHNHMLYPMNLVNGDNVCPSHSTYYAVLGAGGVINLAGFLGLYAYFIFCFIKCLKFNRVKTIGLSVGFLGFFLYSFTEGVNYLIAFYCIPLIFYYNLLKNGYLRDQK